MFKPHTIEQFKVLCYINEQFERGSVLISPASRTALKVSDRVGDSLVFDFLSDHVVEVDERPVPSPEVKSAFLRQFWAAPCHPVFQNLEDIVRWWHQEERPINFQQALGLPDDLFLHFLEHDIIDTEEVTRLVSMGRVSEEQYLAIRLWYKNGNFGVNWLGPTGVDGTGSLYELALNYRTGTELRFPFYVMDEYYKAMNDD